MLPGSPRIRSFIPAACCALLLLPAPGRAAANGPDLFLGADLTNFNYREFDTNGREVDRERGVLPGVRITARTSEDRLFARIDGTYHAGTVNYDGETQSGTPVTTDTDTRLLTIAADVGHWFGPAPYTWGAYLHLARRNWDRDIQSRPGVGGIYEEYRWSELGLGVRHVWEPPTGSTWHQELTGTLLRATSGTIFVRLSDVDPGYDDTTLNLGDRTGFRLRYTASHDMGERTLRIEPYLEYWEFGRSNTEIITANGSNTAYTVTEPRSESTRIGVAVGLVF